MRNLPLVAAMMFMSCLRSSSPAPGMSQEDESVVFPEFFDRFPIVVGEQGQPYELDGVILRAIAIAANDFIPPFSKERQCWDRQEAQLYRVIRQGDIVFVRIDANPSACERKVLMFDSGVQYAISTDGRILRRVFDGEPGGPSHPQRADAGAQETLGEEVPASLIGAVSGEPMSPLPEFLRRRDAGSTPQLLPSDVRDAGPAAPWDGGGRPDGGSPTRPSR